MTLLKRLVKGFCRRYKILEYFILPNALSLIKRRLIIDCFPQAGQLILCKGQGSVRIGKGCSIGDKMGGFNKRGAVELQARNIDSKISIGSNVWFNNNVFVCAVNYINIGDDSLIGQNVVIMDHEAHGVAPHKRRALGKVGTVEIGKNVWIGNNVTILKNSKVGDNSIVATGAVVSGVFSANTIIGGVPAKIIRNI